MIIESFKNEIVPTRGARRGLTLIEMLLVLSFLSMTGLAVYQALSSGIRIWQRGQQITVEGDLVIFLDKVSSELRKSFTYPGIKFEGKADRLAFPTRVYVQRDKRKSSGGETYEHQIGRVEYSLDRDKGYILRREANYSQALEEKFMTARRLMGAVTGLKFRYIYLEKDRVEEEADTQKGIPQAVEVTVNFKEKGGQIQTVRRFIQMPSQGISL